MRTGTYLKKNWLPALIAVGWCIKTDARGVLFQGWVTSKRRTKLEKRMSLLAVPPLQSLHLLKLPDSADDAAARPAISSREGSMRRRAMELRLKTDLIACSWEKSLYKEFPKEPKGPKKDLKDLKDLKCPHGSSDMGLVSFNDIIAM